MKNYLVYRSIVQPRMQAPAPLDRPAPKHRLQKLQPLYSDKPALLKTIQHDCLNENG